MTDMNSMLLAVAIRFKKNGNWLEKHSLNTYTELNESIRTIFKEAIANHKQRHVFHVNETIVRKLAAKK